MGKREITIDNPVTVGGVTLIPIVKTWLNCWRSKARLSFFGINQPVSIVVVSPQTKRAFRINGEEVSLDQLMTEVSGIKEILEGI